MYNFEDNDKRRCLLTESKILLVKNVIIILSHRLFNIQDKII